MKYEIYSENRDLLKKLSGPLLNISLGKETLDKLGKELAETIIREWDRSSRYNI